MSELVSIVDCALPDNRGTTPRGLGAEAQPPDAEAFRWQTRLPSCGERQQRSPQDRRSRNEGSRKTPKGAARAVHVRGRRLRGGRYPPSPTTTSFCWGMCAPIGASTSAQSSRLASLSARSRPHFCGARLTKTCAVEDTQSITTSRRLVKAARAAPHNTKRTWVSVA